VFGDDATIVSDGVTYDAVFVGDKGYRLVPVGADAGEDSLGKGQLMPTKSAVDAKDDDADEIDEKAAQQAIKRKGVVVCSRIAHHRAVVERVFGMLQRMSAFIRGPITVRQAVS